MREPKEHMWEVASLKTCHGLHMLSVTEVPDQPWLEAHKAPHCESRTSLWGEEKVIKKKKKWLYSIRSFHAFVGMGLSFIKNIEELFSVNQLPGEQV